jgi:G3E family GTPase
LRGLASAQFEEAAAQWAGASRIVLTKVDAITSDRLPNAQEEAEGVNPLAEIVATADRELAVRMAFAPLVAPAGVPDASHIVSRAHPRVLVQLARQERVPSLGEIGDWLDNLAGLLGERLLRLKGLVQASESDGLLLVQSVGTLFSMPRPFADSAVRRRPFLVIIARDTSAAELEAVEPRGLFTMSATDEPAPFKTARRTGVLSAKT